MILPILLIKVGTKSCGLTVLLGCLHLVLLVIIEGENFRELSFPSFSRVKFSQIITDCVEYLGTEKETFRG